MQDTLLPENGKPKEFNTQLVEFLQQHSEAIDVLTSNEHLSRLLNFAEGKMAEHSRSLAYHQEQHAEVVGENFSSYIDFIAQQEGSTINEQQAEKLKKIGQILAWFHDVDLHTLYGNPNNLQKTDEEHSAQIMREQISYQFTNQELTDKIDSLITVLEQAIFSTKVKFDNGAVIQFEQGSRQGENPFADLLYTSDLGYFGTEDEDELIEFSLRFGIERGILSENPTPQEWSVFWGSQVTTLEKYSFPTTLPKVLLDKLNEQKEKNGDMFKNLQSNPNSLSGSFLEMFNRLSEQYPRKNEEKVILKQPRGDF